MGMLLGCGGTARGDPDVPPSPTATSPLPLQVLRLWAGLACLPPLLRLCPGSGHPPGGAGRGAHPPHGRRGRALRPGGVLQDLGQEGLQGDDPQPSGSRDEEGVGSEPAKPAVTAWLSKRRFPKPRWGRAPHDMPLGQSRATGAS